ncbi:hypothetical protein ACFRFQ_10405 [Rhodococcus sp. NPDC056743]
MMFHNAKPMNVRLPSVWDATDLAKRVRANQSTFDEFCSKSAR